MSRPSPQSLFRNVGCKPTTIKSVAGTVLMLSLSWSLGACSADIASRNTGERLTDRGNEIRANGTAWSDGQKSVQQGEKAIERSSRDLAQGERDQERARKDLAKAEQQISDASATKAAALKRVEDGRMRMTRAEADYAATKAGPSAVRPEY